MFTVTTRWLLAMTFTASSGSATASSDLVFIDGFDDTIYFIVPYAIDGSLPASPTSVKHGRSSPTWDIGLIVDTTGSMGGELANLKNTLSTSIIAVLQAQVPSLGIGIAGQDDIPYSTFGMSPCDAPFYLGGHVTTVTANAQTAVNTLAIHCGADTPEAQIPAIYHAITGSGITWPTGLIAPVNPAAGTFGALQFRSDAFPIIINITDASQHNGKRALDKTGTSYDTSYQNAYSFSTWNVDDVVTTMNSYDAKFIGIAADNGARGEGADDPYGYQAYLADKTGSDVAPGALVHVAGCADTQCCTGVSRVGVAVDGPGGACRLVFSIKTDGTGLSNAIVDGVEAIVSTTTSDMYVEAYNDAAETTDVIGNFLLKVEPDPSGGTDPLGGGACVSFPPADLADNFTGAQADTGSDGVYDTITNTSLGAFYCFNVTPKANSTVPATTSPQKFHAHLRSRAIRPDGTFTFGIDRQVIFLVPPGGS